MKAGITKSIALHVWDRCIKNMYRAEPGKYYRNKKLPHNDFLTVWQQPVF